MLPGTSLGPAGRTPPLPPPGVLNDRYSPMGNVTDSKDHPNVLSRKLRVALGSVLASSENARVPCVLDSCFVGFFPIVPVLPMSVEIDIHWIVYIGTRGWKDSGSIASVDGSDGAGDLSTPRVPGGPNPGEREAVGPEMDATPPEGHGVPEAHPVRPVPPEQPRADSKGPVPAACGDGGGGAAREDRDGGPGDVSTHVPRGGWRLHPPCIPAIWDQAPKRGTSGRWRQIETP